jgi:hypothetical protein
MIGAVLCVVCLVVADLRAHPAGAHAPHDLHGRTRRRYGTSCGQSKVIEPKPKKKHARNIGGTTLSESIQTYLNIGRVYTFSCGWIEQNDLHGRTRRR